MLGQIKPSFINGTPVADLAALTGKSWLHAFSWPSLEPTTVDTRVFYSDRRNHCLDGGTQRRWTACLPTESVGQESSR